MANSYDARDKTAKTSGTKGKKTKQKKAADLDSGMMTAVAPDFVPEAARPQAAKLRKVPKDQIKDRSAPNKGMFVEDRKKAFIDVVRKDITRIADTIGNELASLYKRKRGVVTDQDPDLITVRESFVNAGEAKGHAVVSVRVTVEKLQRDIEDKKKAGILTNAEAIALTQEVTEFQKSITKELYEGGDQARKKIVGNRLKKELLMNALPYQSAIVSVDDRKQFVDRIAKNIIIPTGGMFLTFTDAANHSINQSLSQNAALQSLVLEVIKKEFSTYDRTKGVRILNTFNPDMERGWVPDPSKMTEKGISNFSEKINRALAINAIVTEALANITKTHNKSVSETTYRKVFDAVGQHFKSFDSEYLRQNAGRLSTALSANLWGKRSSGTVIRSGFHIAGDSVEEVATNLAKKEGDVVVAKNQQSSKPDAEQYRQMLQNKQRIADIARQTQATVSVTEVTKRTDRLTGQMRAPEAVAEPESLRMNRQNGAYHSRLAQHMESLVSDVLRSIKFKGKDKAVMAERKLIQEYIAKEINDFAINRKSRDQRMTGINTVAEIISDASKRQAFVRLIRDEVINMHSSGKLQKPSARGRIADMLASKYLGVNTAVGQERAAAEQQTKINHVLDTGRKEFSAELASLIERHAAEISQYNKNRKPDSQLPSKAELGILVSRSDKQLTARQREYRQKVLEQLGNLFPSEFNAALDKTSKATAQQQKSRGDSGLGIF